MCFRQALDILRVAEATTSPNWVFAAFTSVISASITSSTPFSVSPIIPSISISTCDEGMPSPEQPAVKTIGLSGEKTKTPPCCDSRRLKPSFPFHPRSSSQFLTSSRVSRVLFDRNF
ncbi:hypothetical protein ACB098_06G229400 [Castanea mollissima]